MPLRSLINSLFRRWHIINSINMCLFIRQIYSHLIRVSYFLGLNKLGQKLLADTCRNTMIFMDYGWFYLLNRFLLNNFNYSLFFLFLFAQYLLKQIINFFQFLIQCFTLGFSLIRSPYHLIERQPNNNGIKNNLVEKFYTFLDSQFIIQRFVCELSLYFHEFTIDVGLHFVIPVSQVDESLPNIRILRCCIVLQVDLFCISHKRF